MLALPQFPQIASSFYNLPCMQVGEWITIKNEIWVVCICNYALLETCIQICTCYIHPVLHPYSYCLIGGTVISVFQAFFLLFSLSVCVWLSHHAGCPGHLRAPFSLAVPCLCCTAFLCLVSLSSVPMMRGSPDAPPVPSVLGGGRSSPWPIFHLGTLVPPSLSA